MNKKQEAAAIKALKALGYKIEKCVPPPQFGDVVEFGGEIILICQYDNQEFCDPNSDGGFFRWGGVYLNDVNDCEVAYIDIRDWEAGKIKKIGHVDLSKWIKK